MNVRVVGEGKGGRKCWLVPRRRYNMSNPARRFCAYSASGGFLCLSRSFETDGEYKWLRMRESLEPDSISPPPHTLFSYAAKGEVSYFVVQRGPSFFRTSPYSERERILHCTKKSGGARLPGPERRGTAHRLLMCPGTSDELR